MRHSRTGLLGASRHFVACDVDVLLVRTPSSATARVGSRSVCLLHGKSPDRIEKHAESGVDAMDSQTQMLLGYHYLLTRAASLGIVPHGISSDPPSETDRNAVAGSLEAVRRTPSRRENEHALSRFPFRPPRIYSRRPRTSAHPPAPTLDVRSQILEQSAYLQQYHAAMAPFLGIQHPPVQSPRGNAEEEIALQALQHMKNVPPSSLAGNSNAAPGAVGTRTPQRTSATRGEGARARVPATRYRLARTRGVATRDETRAVPLASRTRASPRTHRAKAIPVFFFFSGRTRDSNRRTRRRSRAEVDRVDSGPSRKTVASFFRASLPIAPDRS